MNQIKRKVGNSEFKYILSRYVVDLGNIVKGDLKKKSFRITNTSTTQIVFGVDRRALANSGVTLTPDKYPKLAPHGQVTVEVGLNSKGKNVGVGAFSTEILFDIKSGPLVLVEIRAFIIVPSIEISSDKLDFGKVQVGMQRIIPIALENTQALPCDWVASYPELEGQPTRKKQEKHGRFVCTPDKGTLQPGQKQLVEVSFVPAISETLNQKIQLKVAANPKVFELSCTGTGEEIQLELQPPEIELPPVFPYQTTKKAFTIQNKSSVPVEVFSYNFDRKYLIEEQILRHAEEHFENNVLLLEPREVGSSLPDFLMETYYKKLMAEDAKFNALDLLPLGEDAPKPPEPEPTRTVTPSVPIQATFDLPKEEVEAPKPVVVLVTGPPLSGKTTHSQRLAQRYGLLPLSLTDAVLGAMELDTPEGAAFRSIYTRLNEPVAETPTPPPNAKTQSPAPVVAKPPELTVGMLSTVLKHQLKAPGADRGVVIDDITCCLTTNLELILAAMKEACAALNIPFVNICLTIDELLISLREAQMRKKEVEAELQAATITPLPEDQYERLDDKSRKEHDLALKRFRDTKKAMQVASNRLSELEAKREEMRSNKKLFSLVEEVERELAEAREQEDPKKKPAPKKGAQVEVPQVVKWEDLNPVARHKRFYSTAKALLEEGAFAVILSDAEEGETLNKISEAIPVPATQANRDQAPTVVAPLPSEAEKADFEIPAPSTKLRIERPPEKRNVVTADGFKIFNPLFVAADSRPKEGQQTPGAPTKPEKAKPGKNVPAPPLAAQPAQPQGLPREDTRWVIPAKGSIELVMQFCSETPREVLQELRFGVVGTSLEFPLVCKTACACPELDRDLKHIFSKKSRGDGDKQVSKAFNTVKKRYEFGPLLVIPSTKPAAPAKGEKPSKQAAADPSAAVAIVELANGSNSEKIVFSNTGLFPAEVNLFTEAEKDRCFNVVPDTFTIGVKESVTVTLVAQPDVVGEIRGAILACIKDNPEPIRLDVCCFGSKPEVTLNQQKDCTVDFGRLLLRRKEERKVSIKNVSALPIKWKIVGAEKLPPELKMDATNGTLDVGAEYPLTISFLSERANTFNIPMKCEIADIDGTAVYEQLPFIVKAESHDVVLEWTKELDFKTVRVGEAKKEYLRLLNKGPYEVNYMFRLPKKLQELVTIVPMEGTLRGMTGFKEAQVVQVEVTFKSDREIQIGKKSADLEVAFIEPTLKELVYPTQNIQLKAEALFNKYQIKPMHINFGPCMYKQKKQATFDIVNTGCFEVKYRLFSFRDGLAKVLEPPPEVDPKAKKVPEKKGAKKGNETAADPTEVQLGAFAIAPSVGAIPVGGSATIQVSIVPEGSHLFSEILGIHIEDRNPQDNPEGIAFDLEAESCVPGIVADLEHPDSDTVFEEQQIISRLDGFKKMSSAFAREEKVFSFGVALSGRRLTERFRLTNPVKVPCTVQCQILPRGDAPDSKAAAEAFDIQGAKIDGGKITIPPHEHRYVTVGFTPSSLNTYSAIFEANVEGGLDPKTKTLRFELRGEGSLPNLALEIPPPPQKALDMAAPVDTKPVKGKPAPAAKGVVVKEEEKVPPNTLVLSRTIVGCKTSRMITVRNIGDLPATIRFTFPMASQPCFSFPARNQDILLAPGAVEKYAVFFEPDHAGEYSAKLTMVVQDNHYEDVTVNILAEGYVDTLTFAEIDESTENRLTIGDCYIERPNTKTFALQNHSTEVVRFNWVAPNDSFKYIPSVGHIQPGALKQIQCVFVSKQVVTDTLRSSVQYQKIRYQPNAAVSDWDDNVTTTKWVSDGKAPPSPEKGSDGDGTPTKYSARSPLRRAVEKVPEPAYTTVEGTAAKDLYVSVTCDQTSWDFALPEPPVPELPKGSVYFKKTKLFQQRTVEILLKNTGKVSLPFNFIIKNSEGDVLVEEEQEFSVEPCQGSIPPNQNKVIKLVYSPKSVGDHRHVLVALLPYGPKPELQIPLVGSSECPLIHFELPISDYFNIRDGDLPAVDPTSAIVEFFSRGVKIRNTTRFMVLNPTNMGYDFEWEELRQPTGGTGISPFRCNTSKGSIHSGKKYEMVFEFTPETLKLRESVWTLKITGPRSTTAIPFLLVGHASEPSVYFDSTRLQFGQVIVGAKTKKIINMENRETVPYPFQFDKLPPNAALSVSPMSGVVSPNSSLPVEITFAPAAEETFNYTLVCKVRKAVSPITCNVKGEGYTTHDTLKVHAPDGTISTLVPTASNTLNLGLVQVNGKLVTKLYLTNQGRYNMDYRWQVPPHPFVTMSPLLGTVLPGGDGVMELTYAPTKEGKLSDHKLVCKITNGNTYTVNLSAGSASPNIGFSWKEHDFGPTFLHIPGTEPHSTVLTLTNRDKQSLAIDCLFDNKEYLEVDVSSFVLPPGEKKDVKVVFLPRDNVFYSELINFSINDLTTVAVSVKGEGTQPKVEVLNRTVRFGTCRIGDKKDVEVKVQCKSKIPTAFSLDGCLPAQIAKFGVSVTPEKEFFLKPKEIKSVIFSFRPQARLRQFSGDMKMMVVGQELPFVNISGSCQGAEVHLDNKQLSFGSVVVGTRVSKRVTIMNTGDLGLEFSWNEKKLGQDYTITPAQGYIAAHVESVIEICYHPTEVGSDGKRENVEVKFSEAPSLALSIVNTNCVEKPLTSETVNFTCRVRETVTNKVTIKNDSTENWTLRPNIDNSIWSGPETLTVKAKESADYVLTYSPQVCTKTRVDGANDVGSLFIPLPNGTALLYRLEGASDPPSQAAPPIERDVVAKTQYVEKLVVSNWLNVPQRFVVAMKWSCDPNDESVIIKGVPSLDVPPGATREYKVNFFAYKEGKITGTVHFTNEATKEYQFYSLGFNVKPAKEIASYEMRTSARVRKSQEIIINNPLSKQVTLASKVDNPDVIVPATVVLPPKGPGKVVVEFFPLLAKEYPPVKLAFSCADLGEFPYTLVLGASAPQPEKPVRVQCALGQLVSTTLRFTHHCKVATDFAFKFLDPKQTSFIKTNGQMVIKVTPCADPRVGQEVSLDVTFEPSKVGDCRETVEISSPIGGIYTFMLHGTCTAPQRQGPIEVKPNQATQIQFKNVFSENVLFAFATDSPQFILAKPSELIPAKKSAVISVQYKAEDVNQTVRCKLTVTGQSADGSQAQWVYYLRGIKESEIEVVTPAQPVKGKK
jgi:hydrocephalus-inducing protein